MGSLYKLQRCLKQGINILKFQKITAARPPSDNKDEDFDDAATGITDAASVYTRASAKTVDEDPIHKDFRLWVIASSDEGRLVPGRLTAVQLLLRRRVLHRLVIWHNGHN